MENVKIGFVGGGNMAASLIGGLIADHFPPERLWVSDPNEKRLEELKQRFGIHATTDNAALAACVDLVVLATKPQVLKQACAELREQVQARAPLLVSVAAGIRTSDIDTWLGGQMAIVRTMPNTPALVTSGATALYANAAVSHRQRELAEGLMRSVGLVVWVDDEPLMDAVTALSGSGPAYFFLVMEALEKGGERLGLPAETARLLALQTAFGAAKMALECREDCATLRQRVTSPGGTTERALEVLMAGDLPRLFEKAVTAARDRAVELSEVLGATKG